MEQEMAAAYRPNLVLCFVAVRRYTLTGHEIAPPGEAAGSKLVPDSLGELRPIQGIIDKD